MSQPSTSLYIETKRASYRRNHPVYSAYSRGQGYTKGRLGYHPLEEDPNERLPPNGSPPPYCSVVSLPYSIDPKLELMPCLNDPAHISQNGPEELNHSRAMAATSAYFSGRPTIFPAKKFNPIKDAKKIHSALRGADIDYMRIISLLSKRSAEQRVAMSKRYVELEGKEIECDLTKSGYGNFEVLVLLSLDSLPDILAFAVYEFTKGLDTDEHTLIQAVVPYSNSTMRDVAESYRKQFNADIIMDLFRNTRGDFRTILMALLQGLRDESVSVDMDEANQDADILYWACEQPLSPNAEVFVRFLTQKSFEQIKCTAQCYKKKYGTALEQIIKNAKFGGYKNTLIAIVRFAMNKDDLLAEWFKDSVKESAVDDWALMQLTLGRSEIDLEDVKKAYQRNYRKLLIKAIGNATSGDYKRLLMAFVGF